jgi:hypothetical protein
MVKVTTGVVVVDPPPPPPELPEGVGSSFSQAINMVADNTKKGKWDLMGM